MNILFRTSTLEREALRRGAFTLIECLVYLSVLIIVVGMAFTAYHQCQKNTVGLMRNAEDVIQVLKAGERWRQDIRTATSKPRLLGNDQLLIPQKSGEIIYSFSNGSVRRKASSPATEPEILRGVKSSRMKMDARKHLTSWRWELELAGRQKVVRVKPLFTFQSVVPSQSSKS